MLIHLQHQPARHWAKALGLCALIGFMSVFAVGCSGYREEFPERSGPTPVVEIGTKHKPEEDGSIRGSVVWKGDAPVFPSLVVDTANGPQRVPNPHALVVQKGTNQIKGAVVFLRGVDPARSKPWTLPKGATVEVDDFGITIRDFGRIGFVRHGDPIQFVSKANTPHNVRSRGALNAAIPLPSQTQPSERMAEREGRIELTSGSNVACAIAHLFVCEHPYYALTNDTGDFEFTDVPAGNYELVAWQPNGTIEGHDRNPETGLICRYRYGVAFEKSVPVTVTKGSKTQINVTLP